MRDIFKAVPRPSNVTAATKIAPSANVDIDPEPRGVVNLVRCSPMVIETLET